jgi:hypothetical protein
MCTVLLSPIVNPIAVSKYFNNIKNIIVDKNLSMGTEVFVRKNRHTETDRQRQTDRERD